MTSSPHDPYVQGDTRTTKAGTTGSKAARWIEAQQAGRSAVWSLQLDSMRSEWQVMADQYAAVNEFPGLVHTARHTTGVDGTGNR